jgi:hypothetical protein
VTVAECTAAGAEHSPLNRCLTGTDSVDEACTYAAVELKQAFIAASVQRNSYRQSHSCFLTCFETTRRHTRSPHVLIESECSCSVKFRNGDRS